MALPLVFGPAELFGIVENLWRNRAQGLGPGDLVKGADGSPIRNALFNNGYLRQASNWNPRMPLPLTDFSMRPGKFNPEGSWQWKKALIGRQVTGKTIFDGGSLKKANNVNSNGLNVFGKRRRKRKQRRRFLF